MGWTCGMRGRSERYRQDFGGKTLMKQRTVGPETSVERWY